MSLVRYSFLLVAALAAGLLFCASDALAANVYWVGADGANTSVASNWKSSDPTGCGGGDTLMGPTTLDVAIFDADCDSSATINSAMDVLGIDMKSGYTGTVTQSAAITTGSSGFTMAGGTFAGGSANITLNHTNGDFVLSGGTFTATSGTMALKSDWTHTAGGTFTHNSGTVTFNNQTTNQTVDVATSETFYNVTADTGTGSWVLIVSGDTMIVTGTLTTADEKGIGDGTGYGTVEARGDVTLNSISPSGSALQFTGSATQTLTVGSSSTAQWDGDVTVNKSGGSVQLASNWTLNATSQDLTLTEGTFDIAGKTLVVAQSSGTFVVEDGGNFQLQGGETVTTGASYPTLNSGSTVTYDGTSGPYTVKDYSYQHLTFNGSGGVFNLGANESVGGNLTITAGTFDISGYNLTVTSTFANDDTFRLQGGETTVSLTMDTNSGTTVYDGTSSYTGLKAGASYYHLTFNGSGGTWTQNAAVDANGNLTITAGTLASAGYGVTVGGNWSNAGTYTHGSNTVTLDGTNQTLTGATTFYNLSKAITSAATLTLPASTTQTIANTLTLAGASGAALSLRSSTSGTQASINPQGTRTVSYLDVKDNNNTNATILSCTTSCTDSGNNTNWSFASANAAPAATAASSISQATDGTGLITFKTTLSDSNSDVTRLKVEYASDLGSWQDLTLDSVTASRGSAALNNSETYQISSIDTDGGSVELTLIWKSKDQIINNEDTTVYLRLTPNDSTADGTAVTSDAFTVDNKAPGISKVILDSRTTTSLTPAWTVSGADPSFYRYTLCYGLNRTHVVNCNSTAKTWTPSDDSALSTQATTKTKITGLLNNRRYYILLRAHDTVGNSATVLGGPFTSGAVPLAPILNIGAVKDISVSVYLSRLNVDGFTRGELCYGESASRVSRTPCLPTGDPRDAVKRTYTSASVLSDIITGLRANTKRYYFKYAAVYEGLGTYWSNLVSTRTCPRGQEMKKNVCVPAADVGGDIKAPEINNLVFEGRSATSLTFQWGVGETDPNFSHYIVCYGVSRSQATNSNCDRIAPVWTATHDRALATQTTRRTTITGLANNRTYYVKLRAYDTVGNESSLVSSGLTGAKPLTPLLAVGTVRDTSIDLSWRRHERAQFQRMELCYARPEVFKLNKPCAGGGSDPNVAPVKLTFTSPTISSAQIAGLRSNARYRVQLAVYYANPAVSQFSNSNIVVTCRPGQYRANGVCVNIPPPLPSPTPTLRPSPSPTPRPSPSVTPTASPLPSPTPTLLPSVTPSPSPDGSVTTTVTDVITAVTETIQAVIEAVTETIVAIVEQGLKVVKEVVAIAREIITSPGTGIPKAQAAIRPVVNTPAFKVTATVTTTAAIVSVAASSAALTSTAPTAASQLPQAASRLWQGFLGLFGFRRRKRPWGRVVDATSGEAIAGVYVQVFDHQTKKLQNTMVSNPQGAFSSLVPPGMYEFRVHKPGWTLTPQAPFLHLVAGEKIYDGKPVAVTEEKVLPLVLALRLTEAAPLTRHLMWRKVLQAIELFLARLSWPLLLFGALLNSLAVFASPTKINIGIEVFYIVLIAWKFRLHFKLRPAIGYVRDSTSHQPLDLALVRLYDAVTGKLIETRTTTAEGKFLLLPSPGVYTISVVREGYQPHREGHVVVNPKREALALAFTLQLLPPQPPGMTMTPPPAPGPVT